MIFDANQLPSGTRLECDVCIIGGGVAGIVLALTLSRNSALKIVIAEGGGFDSDPFSTALYTGEADPADYPAMHKSRLRYLGGSSNHWGGWTLPLRASDFAPREFLPRSGWPITRESLARYDAEASRWLQLNGDTHDTAFWLNHSDDFQPLHAPDMVTDIYRLSPPTRFGEAYRQQLKDAENIYLMLHANAVDLVAHENARAARQLVCMNQTSRRFEIAASQYVLAAGGIENPRLMLNFRSFHRDGLGNEHGNVGRYFSDHVGFRFSQAVIDGYAGRRPLYDPVVGFTDRRDGAHRLVGGMSFSDAYSSANGLRNTGFLFQFRGPLDESGLAELPQSMAGNAGNDPGLVDVFMGVEQAPNRDSRVSLVRDKDLLGMNKAELDFRLDKSDAEAVNASADHFARVFSASGLGRVKLEQGFWPPKAPEYGSHHMGTTRMSLDPRDGVVDPDCRVHGVDNVFVAGSSVFPTYGYAQPTWTIVCLALRLAETLGGDVS
jgi:choline dehydrogenase-like flavoprotein